jgi:hypothetical protein
MLLGFSQGAAHEQRCMRGAIPHGQEQGLRAPSLQGEVRGVLYPAPCGSESLPPWNISLMGHLTRAQ